MLKLECNVCGAPLSGVSEKNVHVVFGGKGAVLCDRCEAQTDEVTMSLTDMREWLRPWGISINGIDEPYSEIPEPDFDIALPDTIPDWDE